MALGSFAITIPAITPRVRVRVGVRVRIRISIRIRVSIRITVSIVGLTFLVLPPLEPEAFWSLHPS